MANHQRISPIPKDWIEAVTKILDQALTHPEQEEDLIEWPTTGFAKWVKHGTRWEAYEALKDSLVPGILGKRIKMSKDEGQTYAFFFKIKNGEELYGKIALVYGNLNIIIYSAHDKEWPTL